MCASKGYPIPYSTELTNPEQVAGRSQDATVAQMDPQGTYPSQNTLAAWVLCINPSNGSVNAQYIEPMVNTYAYPVEIREGKVVQTGRASGQSAIDIACGTLGHKRCS